MGLKDTTWVLVQFETDAEVIPAVPQAPATLTFTTQNEQGEPVNRISGSGGCNRYFGSYTLTDDHVSFGAMGSTRMMCDPERMMQEDRFFQALQVAERYELRDGELLITYAGGTVRFTGSPEPRA